MTHYKDIISMSISRYGEELLKKNIHFPLILMIHEYTQEPLNNNTFHNAVKNFKTKEIMNRYGKISYWNVSNVTDMALGFINMSDFNEPLDLWDVSNVTNMTSMFYNVSNFNQPLGSWNVSNVAYMNYMFSRASSFNQPLDSWDISKVIYMRNVGYIFKKA